MNLNLSKSTQVLLAAVVTAMVVLPVALAGAQSPTASSSAAAGKQLKALNKKIGKLNRRIVSLEAKQAPVVPSALPPTGPAGGDLTGNYPKPRLAPESVGTAQLAFGGVQAEDLGSDAVGGGSLAPATATVGAGVVVNPGETKSATVSCPGSSRVIGGGFEWGSGEKNGGSIISSSPSFVGSAEVTWEVQARVDTGGQTNTIFAEALCLGV